jgi:hypothetical protein
MLRLYIDQHFKRHAFDAAGRQTDDDHRLERLIRRLPERRQPSVRWLRSPKARWVRLPLGGVFILGSFLFVLPIFGLWMLPVGLLLLAEDLPALRRLRTRILDWTERHRPHWFCEPPKQVTGKEETT